MLIKRVIAGLSSNLIFQAINASIQLFGVPLCLIYWGSSYYGEWLLLFTIPGFLSLSDFGLGTSSAAEMSMMEEDHRRGEIEKLLRSVFWFIVIWAIIPFGLLWASNYVFPWYEWLKLNYIGEQEFKATFPLLILYIYVSLFLTVPLNFYRVIKKYHVERYITSAYKSIEFLILLVLVVNKYGVYEVALGYVILRISYLLYIIFDLYKRSDLFRLWPITLQAREVKKVIRPGISGLLYLLGGNMLNQGLSTIIGLNFGPQKLVMFNTIRMLVNVSKQFIGIINLSVYAEFSYAFGAKNKILLRKIFRTSMIVNVFISLVSCTALYFLGEWIISSWTSGIVEVDKTFFTLYLVYALFGAISSIEITLMAATNNYKFTGIVYLMLVAGVVSLNALCIGDFGLPGSVISLIGFEILFIIASISVIASMLETRWTQLVREFSFRDIFSFHLYNDKNAS